MRDRDADDRDFEFIGAFDHLDPVEHDDITRRDRKTRTAVLREVLDGLETNGRNIGSSIMLSASTLGERPSSAFAEGVCPLDHPIGAFDRFDGDHIQITHRQRLTDVETQELGEHGPYEIDIRLLRRGGLRQRHHAWLRELALDGDGRVDERDSLSVEFLSDRSQQRMGAPVVPEVFVYHHHRSQVGDVLEKTPPAVHDLGFVDIPDHDCVGDPFVLQSASPGPDPEDPSGFEAFADIWKGGVVSAVESDGMNRVSHLDKAFRDEDRKPSTSSDQSDRGRWWWGVRQDGKNAGHGLWRFYQYSHARACLIVPE